jgi:hypothetical protein
VDAFCHCTSLFEIVIPLAVKRIKCEAFYLCLQLTNVNIGKGLEVIEMWTFYGCTLLHGIIIPPSVKTIKEEAFKQCSQLMNVHFCDEIEEFVSGVLMPDGWNHGVHKKSQGTYCFLVRCNVPKRLDLLLVRQWQANIHRILRRIPSISPYIQTYFNSINFKLSEYKNLEDAVCKSRIAKQSEWNNDLVQSVLSFL